MDFLSITFFFTALAIILEVLIVKFLTKKFEQKHGKKKKYHPVGGTIFHQLANFNRVHDYITDLASKHKTYRLLSPFRKEIYTADPENIEYIVKTNFDNYGKGWYHHEILYDLLGDGIFTVDGDKWLQQRKLASYEFSTKVLRDYSSVIFRKNAAKVAKLFSEAAKSNEKVEVQELFMKSTLDSIFQIVFGVELDTMCGSSEEGNVFSKAFDTASEITLYRYVDVFWKVKRYFNIGSEATLKKNLDLIDTFVYKLIRKKIEQIKNSQDDSTIGKKEDLLSRFLKVNDNDLKYLRDIILNFVAAGKDSTAVTLAWFMYMVCKHPEVQEKAAQEVRRVLNVKHSTSFAEFANSITDEAQDQMHYLHGAISEALRLYPALPLNPKMCLSDDTLPDGYSVNKGDMLVYLPYSMGRMKFLWGDDAEEFKPERWLDENGVYKRESPFKFATFQAGPRVCQGKEFAYRQMKIFTAVLFHFFEFKLSDEKTPVNYKSMISLHVDNGLLIRSFPRSGS